MHQNTDWEKEFDELWEHYNLSRAEVDREIVSDFIRSLLQAREEWLLNDYTDWLLKKGYADDDVHLEGNAVDEYRASINKK